MHKALSISAVWVLLVGCCTAQATVSSYEIGFQGSLLSFGHFGTFANSPGLGGRFTYNLTDNFAVDSELNFYPVDYNDFLEITSQSGGRRWTAVVGLKGGIRRKAFGLFGKVRPGLIGFSRVAEPGGRTRPRESFMLDLGGVLEIYPSQRTILRFDASRILIRFNERVFDQGGGASLIAIGKVDTAFQFGAGVGFRLGDTVHESPQPQGDIPKLELGAQFSAIMLERFITQLRDEPGFGGRLGYNFRRYFGVDAEINYFPRNPKAVTPQEGGTITQGLFGVKAGIRKRKVGFFGKIRPGLVSFSQTQADLSQLTTIRFSRLTHAALDLGGVIEVYVSRNALLRFDAGNTRIFFGKRTVPGPGGSPISFPGFSRDSLQISSGVAWRF